MYCSGCGNKLHDGSDFCGNCGAKVIKIEESAYPEKPLSEPIVIGENPRMINNQQSNIKEEVQLKYKELTKYIEKPEFSREIKNDIFSNKEKLDHLIGRNSGYYIREFNDYINNGRTKFNYAAFFLWIYHAFYRNTWREFFYMMYKPFLAFGGLYLTTMFLFSKAMMGEGDLITVGISATALGCSSIWTLARLINYSKNFNAIYMHYIDSTISEEDVYNDKKNKRVIISFVLVVAVVILNNIVVTSLFYI